MITKCWSCGAVVSRAEQKEVHEKYPSMDGDCLACAREMYEATGHDDA